MAFLLGIDEAGYGPLLGPLVVSVTGFCVPDSLIKGDLWQILSDSLGKRKKGLAGRLLVTDSKRAYSRSAGIAHLQRTVLAALTALGNRPGNLTELINIICPESLPRLRQYQWYEGLDSYQISSDSADISIAGNALKKNLAANEMALLTIRSYVLDVAYYNHLVSSVKNKATVLFTAVATLMKEAFDNFTDDNLQIIVDRQGGRVNYTPI